MARRYSRPPQGWGNATNTFTLTAHATPHTVGNWTDIIAGASVLRDVSELAIELTASIGSTGANTSMLLDIGLGGSGTSVDYTVVSNIPVGYWGAPARLVLPLHVPAGTRIAGRIRAAVTVDTFAARAFANYGGGIPGFAGFHEGVALNMNTAASTPTHGDLTDNAFEQIVASTTADYRAFQIVPCGTGTGMSNGAFTIDLGVGGAGSEQVIGLTYLATTSVEVVNPYHIQTFYYPLAAGSRLALRKNSTVDCSGTILAWR